ncbi:hypothetical protein HMPREF9089_00820 [Eubacterium brachy ATCC 33089]|nr:hypothetical protein HMPREF9089_00820 [Eubacterium brachy ATCC 33089]
MVHKGDSGGYQPGEPCKIVTTAWIAYRENKLYDVNIYVTVD